MDWFRHDLYASNDIKIRKLIHKYGYEAYGLYWFIVELIYRCNGAMILEDLTEELELADKNDDIVYNLQELGLLHIAGGIVTSNRIQDEVSIQQTSKKRKVDAGKKGMESRYSKMPNTVITEMQKDENLPNTVITEMQKDENLPNTVITEMQNLPKPLYSNNICNSCNNNVNNVDNVFIDSKKDKEKKDTTYLKKKTKEFLPPSLQEVEDFCSSRNNNVNAKKVYDYYSAGNWHDQRGEPIKNWKQKIIAVWEKDKPKNTVCNDPSRMASDMNSSGGFDL